MKRIIRVSTALFSCALVSACGGSGGDNTESGSNSTGRMVTVADYLIPSETVEFSVRELSYENSELVLDETFTQRDEVLGNLLTSFEDGFEDSTTQLTGNEVILSSSEDSDPTITIPSQVNVGQSVTQNLDLEPFFPNFGVPLNDLLGSAMITFTFTTVHDSFSISAPDQVGPTFSDVLQVDLELNVSAQILSSLNAPDGFEVFTFNRSTIYFSREVGFIGSVDNDCLLDAADGPDIVDDSQGIIEACDTVIELFDIRLN